MADVEILRTRDLSVSYGSLVAVRNVALSFEAGSFTGVFGHNGSGKSTFLKSLVGIGGTIEGTVEFDGLPVAPGRTPDNVMRGIGIVPQSRNVFPSLTVSECLEAAGLRRGNNSYEQVYELLPLLKDRGSQRAGSMSGGEQQLLAVGMALMMRPKVMLLDEPTAGLAPVAADRVLATLKAINSRLGTTVVLVEQNVMAALRVVERAVVFRSGYVVLDAPASDLRSQKDLWAAF
jgi:branched-chain amino acid transport system ATP-binding protein